MDSFASLIHAQASARPDHPALVFLADGETEALRLNYRELDRRARACAAKLQSEGLAGQPVLLALPSSDGYVSALLGCLYAGALAVPAYPAGRGQHAQRLAHIVADAQPAAIVVANDTSRTAGVISSGACPLPAVADLLQGDADAWTPPAASVDATAYLQYTSGSTSQPRGVQVTHRNLIEYCRSWMAPDVLSADDVVVSWLPLFHDFGLVQGLLQPLQAGATIVLMPPMAFLQRPARWLQAISRYCGTISCAPDFAYSLAAAAEVPPVDLSSWAIAGNAAEPVRADTLARFVHRFGPQGFRAAAMNPSYGLAEATLGVTFHARSRPARVLSVDPRELQQGRINAAAQGRRLVSCGRPWGDTRVVIVNPQLRSLCPDGRVGEIWVQGSIVAAGYAGHPQATEAAFDARLDNGEGPFLRTGDLGCLHDGELYVTGRLKDLIIVRGQNHYPQDVEQTVESAHPVLHGGRGAAFSIDTDQGEALVVVQEVRRSARLGLDGAAVARAVRRAVAEAHGLWPQAVVLVPPAAVPLTSSGKVQRGACREAFLERRLKTLHVWRDDDTDRPRAAAMVPSSSDIAAWLTECIGALQQRPASTVDMHAPFSSLGLDSASLVGLSAHLGDWLGRQVSPTLPYSAPTIAQLAAHLAGSDDNRPPTTGATAGEPIAVVGMACRLPGADGLEAYWALLGNGADAITEVPPERWSLDGFYQPGAPEPGKSNSKWGGFIQDVDRFDAAFFGISPREAQSMDPQQRLLLEGAWHALEDAGIVPASLAGSDTGVFIGAASSDYETLALKADAELDAYCGTGVHASIMANRISYLLDLRGPSVTLQTACSASMMALHEARAALLRQECGTALVGGVNLLLAPQLFVALSQARMMSPDGRCMAFDARANGYVRAEGCVMLVLKRLSDALRDNDRIHGIVAGSAVNQDGRSNGLTAPNGAAQQAVIEEALAASGVAAGSVSYVEAHGTGTGLGDPIEMEALNGVYGRPSDLQPRLWVGAVKSQIGHTESAAGLAGLVKVLLAMRHERIPANLHLRELNPRIALDGSRCAVVTQPQPWPRGEHPRRAGVSAFGFGGTNVHVIVQEPPAPPAPLPDDGEPELLVLSACTPAALQQLAQATADSFDRHGPGLPALCHTATVRRTHFTHRLAVVGATRHELAQALRSGTASESGDPGRIAFLFTGQGSQYPGMAQSLYRGHALFRRTVDHCDEILRPLLGVSLVPALAGAPDAPDLSQTRYAQPALLTLEYALAQLWLAAGARPDGLLGHSLGEYAAACLGGVFSLEDALTLVAHRGRLMHDATPPGAMIALQGSEAVLDAWLAELDDEMPQHVAVAARNSPTDLVLSGEPGAAEALAAQAVARGAVARPLPVTRAFHSPLMDGMLEAFEREARRIRYAEPRLAVISNLDGRVAGAAMADARYWVEQIRRPVQFMAGLRTLQARGCRSFIEIGPHPVLSAFGRQVLGEGLWLPSLRRGVDAQRQLLSSLGRWYEQGAAVDWRGWWHGRRNLGEPQPADLPRYPMQRERHWFTPGRIVQRTGPSLHPLLRERLPVPGSGEHRLAGSFSADEPWFVAQSRLYGLPRMPAAGAIEALLAAARFTVSQPLPQWTLKDVVLHQSPLLCRRGAVDWQAEAQPCHNGSIGITLRSQPAGEADVPWTECASGSALPSHLGQVHGIPAVDGLPELPVTELYQRWNAAGLEHGPRLQGLKRLWLSDHEAVGRIEMPEPDGAESLRYQLHPAALEACLQAAQAAAEQWDAQAGTLWLPTSVASLTVMRRLSAQAWVRVVRDAAAGTQRPQVSIDVFDDQGRPVVLMRGLGFSPITRARLLDRDAAPDEPPAYGVRWMPMTVDATGAPPASPWLLLGPDPAALDALAAACRDTGVGALAIGRGAAMRWQRDDHVVLDWSAPAQWGELIDALRARGVAPAGLWWHAADAATSGSPAAAAHELCRCGFLALHHLLPRWMDEARHAPDLLLCTRGATTPDAAVEAGECLGDAGLAQSVFNGFVKSLAMDYPFGRCVQVDLPPDETALPVSEVLAAVRASRGSSQLALREGEFWQARAVPRPPQHVPPQPVVQPDASYLVTGGLRGIGLASARWLVDQGARHLVLLGRSVPATAHVEIAAMEAAGAAIAIVQADVADAAALQAGLARALAGRPPLRGVLHCAGLTDDRMFAEMDWPAFERVLAPKVQGAWNLHRLTCDTPLDFFVLYSSSTAFVGNAGQANYIAACAFLDSLAVYRRHRGLPASSVQWGYWSDTGMAANSAIAAKVAHMGLQGITTAAGMRALHRVLATAPVQIAPGRVDWDRFRLVRCPGLPPTWLADLRGQRPTGAGAGAEAAAPAHRLPPANELAAMPSSRARPLLLAWLLDTAAPTLRLPAHQRERLAPSFAQLPLQQLGFDSLMAVEMSQRIRNALEVHVPLAYFMTGATAAELADHLHRQLAAARLDSATDNTDTCEEILL